jgi:hypothetical protein
LGASALLVLSAGSAWAQSSDRRVCYADVDHPPTRIVLNVKFHSRLPTTRNGGRQDVWDADGKHAYTEGYPPKNRMAVFDGAVVTSSGGSSQPPGAHLGGTSYFVRGGAGPKGGQSSPIFWECTSDDWDPTPVTWYCTIFSDNFKTLSATLKKVPVTKDCDVFQDTKDY